MQTTYGRRGREERGRRERRERRTSRQLRQLLICLVVFALVFVGKGVWPEQTAQAGGQLLQFLHADTDVRGLLLELGGVLTGEESSLGEFGKLCVAVFAPQTQQSGWNYVAQEGPLYRPVWDREEVTGQTRPDSTPREQAPAAGAVVQETVYDGPDLPAGYSMQWLSLGQQLTATPVFGAVTSHFGYREHPVLERDSFHTGVDIAADEGTRICAFADGMVSQVGENEDHGRFVRLRHENGVESLYAHCSRITVEQGAQVNVGQQIALVGSTGRSTGAHLHFEVQLDGVGLDPLRYIRPEGTALALG